MNVLTHNGKPILVDGKLATVEPRPLTVTENGKTYESASGFSPVTVDIPAYPVSDTEHVVNGKWVCPDDWDDVETIPLPEDETDQILYLVYRTDLEVSYISWGTISGAYKYTKGHVVGGQFVPTEPTVNKVSGSSIQEFLESDFETSGKNTIVFKIEPQTPTTKLTGTKSASWTVNDATYVGTLQSEVIRYGQLYYATSIVGNSYLLECDNVRNCKSLTTCNGIYGGSSSSNNLKKHRHTGWDTSNVSSFSGFLQGCRNLVDCDTDFSGMVTSKCENISNFISYCTKLSGEINVSNWDTSNVVSISSFARESRAITKFIGIEGWNLSNCSTSDYVFNYCFSLYQNEDGVLDLSNWHLSENATAVTSKQHMFSYMNSIRKIIIKNFNFNNASNISNFFYQNLGLEEIDMRNISPVTKVCTSAAAIFQLDTNLKKILYDGDGIFYGSDLSGVTIINSIINSCLSLEAFNFGTPANGLAAGAAGNNTCSTLFSQTEDLKTLDMSGIDIRNFTYNQLTGWFMQGCQLKEFYPPQGINNNFTYNASYVISKASLLRIIEALLPQTSAKTLTLGAVNKARLTDEEIAIATEKGWVVA